MVETITDEHAIMIVIGYDTRGTEEMAWLLTKRAELGHERAAIIIIITREYLHSIIAGIGNEQETSMMVELQGAKRVELTISIALLIGADRELDSSITIKSIAFHPSTNQPLFLSPTTRPQIKEM